MSFERARVAEVWASRDGGQAGSGYLITDRHVLTAAHVLQPMLQNPIGTVEVRCLGEQEWSKARLAWDDTTLDLAILELVEGNRHTQVAPVRWGRIIGNPPVSCTAVGFPDAQERPDHTREPEQVVGQIPPVTLGKARQMAVHVLGSAPSALTQSNTAWAGMSGAGVFVGSVLVGVVVRHPANFGTDRLTATPVSLLAQLPEVVQLLESVRAELSLEPVPQIEGVAPPRKRRLPPPDRRSPSMLVRPENAVVPFRGRQTELESFSAWCAEDGWPIRLLVAPAGMGKTRLATELAERMDAQGWFSGCVSDRAADDVIEQVAALGSPSLLVVDDAETRPNLAAMLAPLARRDPREVAMRVLLLARSAGDWWQQLQNASAEMETLLAGDPGQELGPLDPVASDRTAAFEDAARAFAAVQGLELRPLLMPDLSRPEYEAVLYVHMAALDAVGTPERLGPGAGARAEVPVLTAIRQHETDYWQKTAKLKGVLDDAHVLERVVLLATLIGANDEDEAASLLRRVPDLEDPSEGRQRRALARWYHDLEPDGPEWLVPLHPDALAEELTAHVLSNSPELTRTAFLDLAPERATSALSLLDRAVRRAPQSEQLLAEVLDADLERLAPSAIAVAIRTGDPIGRVLARVLAQRSESARVLAQLLAQIPDQTVALREVAVVLAARAIEIANKTGSGPVIANALNAFSVRLSDLGRTEEAVGVSQEAVGIYRELATARADTFRPYLAGALSNLSNGLADVERPEDALTASQEAVGIYRELATARPDTFRPDLAGALSILSNGLADLERREDALTASREAVGIYRELATARPEAFRPGLAGSLTNLSLRLATVGRREEAVVAIQEAVKIRRGLAAAHPDAFRADLALSLNDLSAHLVKVSRREEALAAAQEAVNIFRELAARRPNAFRPNLARSLNTLSTHLAIVGRYEQALAESQTARAIYDELVAARPDAFRPNRAENLNNVSLYLSTLGRNEEALAAIQAAVMIYGELATALPRVHRSALIRALLILSEELERLGRDEEAAEARDRAKKLQAVDATSAAPTALSS